MIIEDIKGQPVIEADRFILRPLQASDAGLITLYAGDERVARMTTSIPHPMPPGAAEAFIARAQSEDRTEDVWVIDSSRSGGAELVGLIGMERMEGDQSEVGYWIAPAFWNTGIASEAVAAILAANPQGVSVIFASVFQDNPASARVLTNCGFSYLGDAESFSVARGSNVRTWTYSQRLKG
ncbi:MAG: GNAT family N-acetyltransferase [Pseudomonadota bacterium]